MSPSGCIHATAVDFAAAPSQVLVMYVADRHLRSFTRAYPIAGY